MGQRPKINILAVYCSQRGEYAITMDFSQSALVWLLSCLWSSPGNSLHCFQDEEKKLSTFPVLSLRRLSPTMEFLSNVTSHLCLCQYSVLTFYYPFSGEAREWQLWSLVLVYFGGYLLPLNSHSLFSPVSDKIPL